MLTFSRIKNAEDLDSTQLGGKSIRGIVTSVVDGDTLKVFHTPLLWQGTTTKGKDSNITIRLAGIDCPELSHFGKPAQPYSKEALDYTKSLLEGKKVKVVMYSKDQYGRVLGMVLVRTPTRPWPLPRKNMSKELMKAGYATVYRGRNAEYGGLKAVFEEQEATAQATKTGMWIQKKVETPAEFKKRVNQK